MIVLYDIDSMDRIYFKNSDLSMFLGINRENRLVQSTISKALSNVDHDNWYSYKGNIVFLPIENLSEYSVNVSHKGLIKNRYLVRIMKPLPWSWYSSSNLKEISMPSRYIIMKFDSV